MVYSFDIFDTLITRATAEPKGIFTIMQVILMGDGRYFGIPSHLKKHFRDFRVDAELETHVMASASGKEDVTLDMIYEQMAYMNHISQESKRQLMELELAVEFESCVPIYDNIEKLKKLRQENEIYLISDMYLTAEHVRRMLTAIDSVFADIPILISGEWEKTKSSGELYRCFLEKYKIRCKQWVHIGDNLTSDYVMAERIGARRCELYQGYAFSEFERGLLERYGKEYAVQFVLGTVKNVIGKADSTAGKIGISTGGPVLFGYVLWVLQEAEKKGIQTLFFVARDGYLLKKIADIIIDCRKLDIQTRYLYGSRYAWRVPAAAMSRSDFDIWVKEYCFFSTYAELVEQLHLSQEEAESYFPKLLQQKGRILTSEEKAFMKEVLLQDDKLFQKIFEVNRRQREEATAYLGQEIESATGKIAFVELNGTGNSQRCMRKLIDNFYSEPVVTFFYVITNMVDVQAPDNIFYKYLHERPLINGILEMLARAPHGQTRGYYQDAEGRWKPILDKVSGEYPDKASYTDYCKGVLRFAREACLRCRCMGEDLAEVSRLYLEHICMEPEVELQEFIGNMPVSLEGTQAGTGAYALKLTDEQIRQIYFFHTPVKECYQGAKLEFSLLRLTPAQRDMMEYYKTLNPDERKKKRIYDSVFFSYSDELSGRVVVYGAGKRGENVLRELQQNEQIDIVLWADKNYKDCARDEMEVSAPDRILEIDYDYVVIAVKDESLILEIRNDLIQRGVSIGKILWSECFEPQDCV